MASSLPIDEAKARFCDALSAGSTVLVQAPTGSGKSTRLPGWAADAGRGPVLVVQPRRVAARALATWVARGRDVRLGDEVGYEVRFDKKCSDATAITFVTPGIALHRLAGGHAAVAGLGTIVVDEFHERGAETDLLVACVRAAIEAGAKTRLVVCSATVQAQALASTLGASVVMSAGRQFEVAVSHVGDGGPTSDDLAARVAAEVARAPDDGDVLVFVPGKREIEACTVALADVDAEVVAVHGGLPPRRLVAAFAEHGHRRIFVATNVAETSLTLPGVTTVVDSGLARLPLHQAGRSVLALAPISAASADQRAGRAGRVRAGRCVRLWSESFVLDTDTAPELSRIELDEWLLRAAAVGLGGERLWAAPWVTAPPRFAVDAARARLVATAEMTEDGALTATGRARGRLPVSSMCARFCADPPPALAGVLADLAALVEVGRDPVLPSSSARVDEARARTWSGARDEVEVRLRALWADDDRGLALHATVMAEVRKLSRALRRALGVDDRTPSSLPRQELVAHLLRRVPQAAFVPRTRRARSRGRESAAAWANDGGVEVSVWPYRVPAIDESAQPDPPKAALVLELAWIGIGRRAQGRGGLLLACAPADLLAAGLGDADVGAPVLLTRGRPYPTIVADVTMRYGGVQLDSTREPLRGRALCEAAGRLAREGRLWPDEGRALLDAVFVWSLLDQLAAPDDEAARAPADVAVWIADRLHAMGVERAEDLSLVGPEDLAPDLMAMAIARGLDPREPERLATDFCRTLSHAGCHCDCEVDLRARRVVLHARSGSSGKPPPAKILPRFRGFSGEFRKASRTVPLR